MTRDEPDRPDPHRWRTAPLRWAWPAYLCATALFVYAVEKAYYAGQGRLGIPGGPTVPDSDYQDLPHVALRQWTLSALGLAGALLVLAGVTGAGRSVPRRLMLLALWGALVPMVAGLPYVLGDGWTGTESFGHRLVGGVRPIAQVGVWVAMAWSYQVRSRVLRRTGEVADDPRVEREPRSFPRLPWVTAAVCTAAYGGLKLYWALGGSVGLREAPLPQAAIQRALARDPSAVTGH